MTPEDLAAAGVPLTVTQAQRLRELGADAAVLNLRFADAAARNAAFKDHEEALTRAGRERLQALRAGRRRPLLAELEEALCSALTGRGFVQVFTPHIITADALAKMGIEPGHPLRTQIFWLADGRCLRPMLAPNLYTLMRRLGRVWRRPFGIFEIGTCFRADTQGARHLNEFTMVNLVEVGGTDAPARARLEALTATVMRAAGIPHYELVESASEVYGAMIDVEVNGMEVCSATAGPHPLDGNWGIVEPWVGLGFGLERLLLAREGLAGIERVGRSVSYLDGVRLNL